MDKLLEYYSRHQRYRLARKTLRFRVYIAFEIMFCAATLAAIIFFATGISDIAIWAASLAALFFSWLHHVKQFFYRPHIFLTCLTWALIFYFVYDLWLASVFGLPQLGPLLLILSGACYLKRGENLVNQDAAAEIQGFLEKESNRADKR